MAYNGIKKLITDDKEEAKRNTSAIVAEQIKAGILAGLGSRAFPEGYQPVTRTETTPKTQTATKATAQDVQPKKVQTPKTVNRISEAKLTNPVKAELEYQKTRQPAQMKTKSVADSWVEWAGDQGLINNQGQVKRRTLNGPIAKNAYQSLEKTMEQYRKDNRIATDTGTAFGQRQTVDPMTRYQSLEPEQKAQWLQPGSKQVQDILSMGDAQRYVNSLSYDENEAMHDVNHWAMMRMRNEQLVGKQKDLWQQAWDALPEGVMKNDMFQRVPPITVRPDDYNDHAEEYDRELYDFYYGAGSHDRIMQIGTRDDKVRMFGQLQELWAPIDNGLAANLAAAGNMMREGKDERDKAEILAEYAAGEEKKARKKLESYQKYNKYMAGFEVPAGSTYRPDLDKGHTTFSADELDSGVRTRDGDRIYSFLSGGKEYQAVKGLFKDGNIQVTNEYNGAMLMTDDERRIFCNLYEEKGKGAAEAFLDGLNATGVLGDRYSKYEQIRIQEGARQFPILSTAASQMGHVASEVLAVPRVIAGLAGDKSAYDPNSPWFKPTMTSQNIEQGIQQSVTEKFGDYAGKVVGVAQNTLSNIVRGFMTRGLGLTEKAQTVGSLTTFFADVYQNSMYRNLSENMGLEESALNAAADSTVEVLEEFIPTNAILGGEGKSGLINIALTSLGESLQEFFGGTVGETLKSTFTGKDEEKERRNQLYVEGFTGPDGKKIYPAKMGAEGIRLASQKAAGEQWQQALEGAAAGFAGGGLGAVYGGVVNAQNRMNLGRSINDSANRQDGKSGAEQIVALAKESTDENVRSAAEKLEKQMGKSGKASAWSVGKLASQLWESTGEKQKQVITSTVIRNVRDQLMERAGEDMTQGQAARYAEIIGKSVVEGKNITGGEAQEIAQSQAAIDTWKAFQTRAAMVETVAQVNEATEPMRSVMDTLGDMAGKVAKSRSAAAKDIDKAIRAAGGNMSAAIDSLEENRGDLISESFAGKVKEILKEDKGEKQSKNFLDDTVKIMLAAKTLAKEMPRTRLDSGTAQKIWEAARAEFDEADAKRVLKQAPVKPGEGTATFEGEQYGTQGWQDKLAGSSLSKRQKNQMGAIGEIARRAGLKVSFINDAARSMINGYERNDGSIVINVAARNGRGMSHHMMTTMSHEMTHWLEQNSSEGYKALRQYIVDTLRGKGVDVENRIMQIMDNQLSVLSGYSGKGEDVQLLSVQDAMAELVAQGSENLLSSETMMQDLAKTSPKAFGEVKKFVKDFTARIRAAVEGMSGSLSFEARTLLKETEEIARLWSSARAEALGRSGEEGTEAGSSTSYSTAVADQEQLNGERYRRIAEQAGLDVPQMLRYSMVGPKATGDYAEMIRQAQQMEKQGADAEEIFRETGARKGFRGRWWVTLDNQNIQMKDGFDAQQLTRRSFDLSDVMDAEPLMEAYPQLKKVKVQAQEMGRAFAVYVKDHNTIVVNSQMLEEDRDKLNTAMRHEIQHVIQGIEGANGGANLRSWQEIIRRNHMKADPLDLYWRTAGEMEANATSKEGGTMPTREQYDNAVAIEDYAPGFKGWKSRMEGRLNRHFSMADLSREDQEYAQAVESGNMRLATEMLLERLKHSENIIPYNAPHGYGGQHKDIAQMIKDGTPEAVARAAADMAANVPDNAVLIPMPPHEGKVTDDTDTMILARAIGELTGRPVVNALESDPRESRYRAKARGEKGLTAEQMGFRQIAQLPEGTIPIFVDNVVGSGETAKAANLALGGGITLAYAKSTRSKGIRGLKQAAVTYDKDGKLIPLSQRFNPDVRDVKYSMLELSDEYEEAYNDYDDEKGEEILAKAAELYMPDSKIRDKNGKLKIVYHQTNATDENGKPFTVFDVRKARTTSDIQGIYFAPEYDEYHEYGDTTYPVYLNITNPAIDPKGPDLSKEGDGARVMRDLIAQGYDGIINTEDGEPYEYVAFYPEQIKSAEPFAEDDDGELIPLLERFNPAKKDIRYSTQEMTTEEYADGEGRTEVKQGEQPLNLMNDSGENVLTILPGNTVAATRYSLASYRDMDERGKMTKALKKAGYTQKEIDKWLKSLDNVANVIASNRALYDFVADRSKKFLKDNGDVYKKTLDASTMCKKTRLYNGTFNVVQHMMPNTILMPEDLIDLFNIMKDLHLETPCGFCYVQSRRRQLGPYTEEWLKEYKGDYIPTVDEVTTSDGLEKLKVDHPQTYTDFVNAMNKKGVNNPKLVQQRTDYRGEIRDMRKSTIDYLNRIGGLRIQSFSDFEVVHMLDMMQAVMDMKAMGLTSQAYTKVPEFAWIFGNTGIKINLSLVGKGTGLDANGKLVFDNDEGMPYAEAMRLRKAYSKNVGTILVGINDDHIIAAMGDDTIDFIIPFHKSGWSANELAHMRGLEHYSDYTESQNEYDIKGIDAAGNLIKVKADSNMDPLDYWEFDQDGEYNARKYLRLCKENHIVPKFAQFLTDNKDGSFSLPEGNDTKSVNIRKGYWKTLIDFKMYDNEGNGSRQEKVEPNFNMDEAMKILEQYDGSHRELPESWEAAEEFVKRYKAAHPLDDVRVRYSTQDSFSVQNGMDMDVNSWMMGLNESSLATEQERTMLQQYKDLKTSFDMQNLKITERTRELQRLEKLANPTAKDRADMIRLRNMLDTDTRKRDRLEDQIIKATSSEGYAGMMYRQNRIMSDLVQGRTAGDVQATVGAIQRTIAEADREIAEREKLIREMAGSAPVKAVQSVINDQELAERAGMIRKAYGTKIGLQELKTEMAAIRLKMARKQDVEDDIALLATRIMEGITGEESPYLNALRGRTIVLSKGQMAELKGQNSSLKEIRSQLRGTGITVKQGSENTLDMNWGELCDLIPSLNRDVNDKDMLGELMRVIRSEQMSQRAGAQWQGMYDNVVDEVRTVIATMPLDIVKDPAAMRTVQKIMGLMQEMRQGMDKSAEEIQAAREQLKELTRQSAEISGMSDTMARNIESTIQYFNALSKQSEAARWRKERVKLIEQLKSENTQKLLKEQEKWKARIEKDKNVREMIAGNLRIRKQIHTNVNRLRKLLINETDLKNVPEGMKGLAREMVEIILRNDMGGGRKITGFDPKDMIEIMRVMKAQRDLDGGFDLDDLTTVRDKDIKEAVADALADIEYGINYYNAQGVKDITSNLQNRKAALEQIERGVTEIMGIISSEQHINFIDRQIAVEDAAADMIEDARKSRFRGEWRGRGSRAINAASRSVLYGNMTPVYFFRKLKNRGLDMHWNDMQRGESRNGLELSKAKRFMAELAERTGYRNWKDQELTLDIAGRKLSLTVQNAMEILAIWRREHIESPENSSHLELGGMYIEQKDTGEGRLRREKETQKAIRLTDKDISVIEQALTDDQKTYMDEVVGYLSGAMSELGNEASMRMYGIKKYKEKYYFPMKVWDGVQSKRSDSGTAGRDENRAAHKSWSKRRINMARNALVIGNFTEHAVSHIVEMINYNTMAPTIENLNRVLNYQIEEADDLAPKDENGKTITEKRNVRTIIGEQYGREALGYIETLMKDLNGGVVQDQRKTLRDRALSMFKKNAVAGSLSVTLQQPLSYIRAAMMLPVRDLAQAILPQYYKGSYAEMMRYSGVAVVKEMGRFDMNFGQSAKDFVTPEDKRNVMERASDVMTGLPNKMDRMTWTRMWSAVKIEQMRLHPEMDPQSEKFLRMVAERFDEVMRRTQVYDSVLSKSSNMRSPNLGMKVLTSFMAEPTLSLNVLEDAVRNVREKGGKALLGKAGATFMLSAVMQALVKGIMSAGRSPDDKKTAGENFLYKWMQAFISEANPISLIPGYSDLIEVLKNGELTDDAMSVIGKLKSVIDTAKKAASGEGKGWYRDLEDTAGQLAQLFTNVPAKNLMRDARAMLTWFGGAELVGSKGFAQRESSWAVIRMQTRKALTEADNLYGVINTWLGDAGYKDTNTQQYRRLYQAMAAGNAEEAEKIREYLELGKGVDSDKIDSGVTGEITSRLKAGDISADEARTLYADASAKMSEDDAWWKVDQIEYSKETGSEKTKTGYYYRLEDAINANRAEEIGKAVRDLMDHGITKEKIKNRLGDWKQEYLDADSAGKIRIRDAITKAYKALGMSAEEAKKRIDGWKPAKSKSGSSNASQSESSKTSQDTTGRYGKGNIDLNNRKVVHNRDGSISTERSFSVNIDGMEVLLPTVINGKIVSEDEAIEHYYKTGEHLGKFKTVKEAEEYAEKLHNRQDWYYNR